jgi:predicted transcriptional regulator
MEDKRLFESEFRFMTLVWDNEPVSSMKLVELCAAGMKWKKSTTFSMLKTMCEKGFARNDHAVVTSLISREEVWTAESERVVENTFAGSLPNFLVSFLGTKKLSREETERLINLIAEHREE